MQAPRKPSVPIDPPLAIYKLARQFVLIVLAGLLLHLLLFGTVRLNSNHMAPRLFRGDRVLIYRGGARPLLSWFTPFRRGMAVVFRYPSAADTRGCLRIAALPGDTITISNGRIVSARESLKSVATPSEAVLPPEFSPRDFAAPFRLPERGDVYHLDSLTQRDFLFVAAMRRQLRAGRRQDVRPELFVDNIPSNEYIIKNFVLYEGRFDSIPDSLDYNWFFWDRLRDNLRFTLENQEVRLQFGLYDGQRRIESFRVTRPFVFLLADNWQSGYDSRYFGPVCRSHLLGSVVLVLWSADRNEEQGTVVRFSRIGTRAGRLPVDSMGLPRHESVDMDPLHSNAATDSAH